MTDQSPPTREQIVSAIDALSEGQRELLLLHRADGLSYAEIGKRLAITSAEVERRMADAIYAFVCALRRTRRAWWRRWL